MMTLSLIIPVYNEEGAVLDIVRRAYHALSDSLGSFEIIVVDDGSTDMTKEIVKNLSFPNLIVIRHLSNRGNGSAIKAGIERSQGIMVATIDADGTYAPEDIPRLLEAMKKTNADMVVGVRQGMDDSPALHKWARRTLRKTAEKTCGQEVPDVNSGLRVCKRRLLEQFMDLYPKKFSFHIVLTIAAMRSGMKVAFEPIQYGPRIGKSKLSSGFGAIANFFKFLWQMSRTSEKIENSKENVGNQPQIP